MASSDGEARLSRLLQPLPTQVLPSQMLPTQVLPTQVLSQL